MTLYSCKCGNTQEIGKQTIRYRDNGTSFQMKAPTYEIENHKLHQVENIQSIWQYINNYE